MKTQGRGSGSAAEELMGLSFVALAVAFSIGAYTLGGVQATEFVVGGATQWTMPPGGNSDYYEDWSKQQSVRVNDTLRFKYNKLQHDVMEVSEDDYDGCTRATPIRTFNTGDTEVAMTRPGFWYFICSYPNHCEVGQKLTIEVQNASLTGSSTPSSSTNSSSSSDSSSGFSARISRKTLGFFSFSAATAAVSILFFV